MEEYILNYCVNRVFVMVKQIIMNGECQTINEVTAYNRVRAKVKEESLLIRSVLLPILDTNEETFKTIFQTTINKMNETDEFINTCLSEDIDENEKTKQIIRLFIINYNRGFLWVWTDERYEAAKNYEASLTQNIPTNNRFFGSFSKKGGKRITRRKGGNRITRRKGGNRITRR
jgi:hypothetical protein